MRPLPIGRRSPRTRRWGVVGLVAAPVVVLVVASGVIGDVALFFTGGANVAGTRSPLHFVNGANYASANAEGFVTVSYPSAAQTAFTLTVDGANGAYGTYLLDVVEVQAQVSTATGWHLRLDVVRALATTGVNAAYAFDCTAIPSAVPDSGVALASGTDALGDPWAVYAPTCAGTQASISLAATGTGTAIAVPGLTTGTSVLFLSFAVDVGATGATTTTSATVVLTAVSP